ncbi:hypothetical protein SNE40_007513 [Patella caerulea]|uniref:Transferrin-like domain-containing protein n=1 Tax=Patella caerulea TaxID=87958 RepID=A0AAN8K635_PATCE
MDVLKCVTLGLLFSFSNCELEVKWCVTSVKEKVKCESLRTYTASNGIGQLRCLPTASRYECWRWIRDGKADLIRVDDTEIYAAGNLYGLIPVAKESFSVDRNADTFMYKAVVVVKKDGPIKSLHDLRGRKSCHTGVRKTVGWVIPVSFLFQKRIMSQADCDNTVKSVAAFFQQSCAPGAFVQINNPGGDNPTNVCEICDSKTCPTNDTYSSYLGAFSCLNNGLGEVAFVKHSTIDDAIASGMQVNKETFRLLCADGSLKHVNEWNKCNWATRPTDVIVTSPDKNDYDVGQLRHFLENLNSSAPVNFFSSSAFGGKDLMFTDNVKALVGVGSSQSNYRTYLDAGYLGSMENFTNCGVSFKWCVISQTELDKCNDMRAAMISKRITRELQCVMGVSHKDCIDKIEKGVADVTTLDGGDLYTGGRYQGIVPIAAETYKNVNSESTSYWAVAVVRKGNRGVNIKNLKDSRSCHTGIMKTSGWNVPIGLLIERGEIKKTDPCNIATNVGEFFKESCVPGVLDPEYDPLGRNPENLCQLCGGKEFCKRDATNKYYGYQGALRCLVEKNADVAFVKHTTVVDVVNSASKEPWSQNLQLSNFELLCQDGSRKPVTQWATCNLAQVPSHAVVTSKKTPATTRKHYQRILSQTQYYYGNMSTIFHLFRSPSGSKDVIFKDSTVELTNIPEFKQNYKTWLGAEYLRSLEAIDVHQCSNGIVARINIGIILMYTFVWSM